MKRTEDAFFFFQAEDGIRDYKVTGVQTCALPISGWAKTTIADSGTSVTISSLRSELDMTVILPCYGSCTEARTAGRAAITSARHRRTRAMLASAFSGTPPLEISGMSASRSVTIRREELISSW